MDLFNVIEARYLATPLADALTLDRDEYAHKAERRLIDGGFTQVPVRHAKALVGWVSVGALGVRSSSRCLHGSDGESLLWVGRQYQRCPAAPSTQVSALSLDAHQSTASSCPATSIGTPRAVTSTIS